MRIGATGFSRRIAPPYGHDLPPALRRLLYGAIYLESHPRDAKRQARGRALRTPRWARAL